MTPFDILTPPQQRLRTKLQPLPDFDFVLNGGTPIALHLWHSPSRKEEKAIAATGGVRHYA
jgi:hypothetical protein